MGPQVGDSNREHNSTPLRPDLISSQPAIIALISGAFLAGSTNIGEFLVFRFFAGAAAFMILAAVPVWLQSPAERIGNSQDADLDV